MVIPDTHPFSPGCGYEYVLEETEVNSSSRAPTLTENHSERPSKAKTDYFTSTSHPFITPSSDEIDFIKNDIARLDTLIQQIYHERSTRCHRLNHLQSPITRLPSHILTSIFLFVCPPTLYNTSHTRVRREKPNLKPLILPLFVLTSVSSHWRSIALSTPQLWCKLDWGWKYHLTAEDASSLLNTYFSKSIPLPFDLKLTVNETWEIENIVPDTDPLLLSKHISALQTTIFTSPNSSRLGTLKLSAPQKWFKLLFSTGFTSLTTLALKSPKIDDLVDLSLLTSLKDLTLTNAKVVPTLPWKCVEHMKLISPHINVSLYLLKKCPNLISFQSINPNPGRMNSPTLFLTKSNNRPSRKADLEEVDVIALPYLEYLEWECIGSYWDSMLFKTVHLPSLKRLGFTGDPVYYTHKDNWQHTLSQFLRHLPEETLSSLDLGYIRTSALPSQSCPVSVSRSSSSSSSSVPKAPTDNCLQILQIILSALPHIKNLTIKESSHDFIEKVMSLLSPSTSQHVEADIIPSPPLPSSPTSPSLSPPSSPSLLSFLIQSLTSSPTSTLPTTTHHHQCLPNLETLSIYPRQSLNNTSNSCNTDTDSIFTRFPSYPTTLLPSIARGDIFVTFLQRRSQVFDLSTNFRLLYLGGEIKPRWRESGRSEIEKLIREGGGKLSVIVDGQSM